MDHGSDTDTNLLGFPRGFSEAEAAARETIAAMLEASPLPRAEKCENLALFMDHLLLGRVLAMTHLYRLVLDVPGAVLELGTRWGQNLSLFLSLRALLEPAHHLRRVVGFDTFAGFPDVAAQDGSSAYARPGNVRTTEGYEAFLERLLAAQESWRTVAHKRKFSVIKGDVRETLPRYLEEHPQTVVALAYFDMDLYSPTREALLAIKPYLVRGSVLAFDELNDPGFPGETVALREVFGLNAVELKRTPYLSSPSYFVYQGG